MKLHHTVAVATLLWLAMPAISPSTAFGRTESELIEMLGSSKPSTVEEALDRLPQFYPNSTNAIAAIRPLLKRKDIIRRVAARALGNYHAELSADEIRLICGLLRSPDPAEVMDGLKALRGLNTPQAVPQITALLGDKDAHIIQDACRTLAVLAGKDVIPAIEPLLQHPNRSVRIDAQDAIAVLNTKP